MKTITLPIAVAAISLAFGAAAQTATGDGKRNDDGRARNRRVDLVEQ